MLQVPAAVIDVSPTHAWWVAGPNAFGSHVSAARCEAIGAAPCVCTDAGPPSRGQ
jgi:hypothetical protein